MGKSHEAIAAYNNALRELNDSKETKPNFFTIVVSCIPKWVSIPLPTMT